MKNQYDIQNPENESEVVTVEAYKPWVYFQSTDKYYSIDWLEMMPLLPELEAEVSKQDLVSWGWL